MLEYLKSYDGELEKRIKTLEINIRSASPSFFDTFRACAECFVRILISKANIEASATSFKKLTSVPEIKAYLTDTVNIPSYAIDKCQDYIAKINKHVHESEKALTENIVVEYLLCLYELTSPIDPNAEPPEISEILSMYNSLDREIEKEKARLTDEHNRLLSEQNQLLGRINIQLNESKARTQSAYDRPSPELEKRQNAKNALLSFLRESTQSLAYGDSEDSFRKNKKITLIFCLITVFVSVLHTVFSILANKIYTTFLLFSNIWHLALLFLLKKTACLTKNIQDPEISTVYLTEINGFDILTLAKVKRRYKLTFIFNLVAATLDIIYFFINIESLSVVLGIILTISAVLSIAFSIVVFALTCHLHGGYFVTVISHRTKKDENGKPLRLYYTVAGFIEENKFKAVTK